MAREHFEAGRWNDAAPLYERVIGRRPSLLDAYHDLGACYEKLGRDSEAIRIYEAAIDKSAAESSKKVSPMQITASVESILKFGSAINNDPMAGMLLSGNPIWLAQALQKIEHYARGIRNEPAEAAPATAHLFIINPLTGEGMDNLFSTHPNTDNRVAELEKLAAELGATGRRTMSARSGGGSAAGPWGGGGSAGSSRGPWG